MQIVDFLDVCENQTRLGHKIYVPDYLSSGKYPIIDQSKKYIVAYTNNPDGLYKDVPIIIFGDVTRIFKYIDFPCFLGADGSVILKVKNPDFITKYVYYALLNSYVPDTGFNRHYKFLKDIKIKKYSKEEQNIIIAILDNINHAIALENKRLALLDELVKARFNEMFIDKNFSKTMIRNVVDINKVSAKKVYKNEDEIKYIDISSIDNVSNTVTGYTVYKFADAPSRAQQCLKTNDILISTVRPNLKNIAIFPFTDNGYVGSSGFCVLRALKCNPQYLKYVVLNDDFTESMVKLTTGASYPAIRDDDVLKYEMIQPPIDLQNRFGAFVESTDKIKTTIRKRLELLKEFLKKKMDEYFGD